ncbi:MAG TPA: PilZ domain-containing protein [Baekduia sp.]|uniref:PilZ domain-containing protein n=1 Tax=Baekduia sp. TaxID=2600305 RepID=UPI002D7892CC|nr:PilZ domain-containing protein [Baekduia sp.]HET6507178.1 PilZ domain-containing protein [Baekduia sp.]
MRRIRDFMPATLSVGVKPMPAIVAATSKDIAWLLPRDPRDTTPGLLPRAASISFMHQGQMVVLHGNADRAPEGTVAFQANREGRVDNLRASPRLDVALPVVVSASGRTIETTTVNVSAGGALVAGGFFGPRDTAVEVTIKLPNGPEVHARGLIVRILPQGTGLRFTDIEPAARDHLDTMVLSIRAALARRFAEKAARDEAARGGRRV